MGSLLYALVFFASNNSLFDVEHAMQDFPTQDPQKDPQASSAQTHMSLTAPPSAAIRPRFVSEQTEPSSRVEPPPRALQGTGEVRAMAADGLARAPGVEGGLESLKNPSDAGWPNGPANGQSRL